MIKRPNITITMVDKLGKGGCSHAHKVGDRFDFDTQRGKLCPMVMHVMFPYVDILRYGGRISNDDSPIRICCPDADVINIFEITIEDVCT